MRSVTVLAAVVCAVVRQMLLEKFDFFPLNRALSLSAMDEDSTESKVDDLLRQVNMLVERQREEVTTISFLKFYSLYSSWPC